MVKKYGLWHFIKYYGIIPYTIFAIVLFVSYPYLTAYLLDVLEIPERDTLHSIISVAIPVIFIILWVYLAFTRTRGKKYHYLTGRNYYRDHGAYNRSYYELVDYFRDADPYRMDAELLPAISWKNAEGVILAKAKNGHLIHVPSGKDGQNYFIFGMPGTGKTAGPVICSCLRFGMDHPLSKKNKETSGSVFCLDIKNDIYKNTRKYRKIKRFDLAHPEKSCHINLLDGIENLSIDDRCIYIENIGNNLLPVCTSGKGEDQYFNETMHDYWNGVALYLLWKDIHTSIPEIIHSILLGNAVDWVKEIVASDCEEAKRRLASKFGENPTNLNGGYSGLVRSIRKIASDKLFLLLGNEEEYEYISPQTLEDGYDCYISLDQADLFTYGSLLSAIVAYFLNGFIQREKNPNVGRLEDGRLRPILFCLDEFAQLETLSYQNTVKPAFMTLRSRNISIACALQSMSSLAEMFHSTDAAKTLIDCVSTFAFLSIQEVATREWASKLIGQKKVLHVSNSTNSNGGNVKNIGRSVTEGMEPIVQPAAFGSLKDDENGKDEIIIYRNGKYIRGNKQYYFK